MIDLTPFFTIILTVLGGIATLVISIFVLAIVVGASEGGTYDEEDFYPEDEEEFYRLKK
jgi:hypothetical protein